MRTYIASFVSRLLPAIAVTAAIGASILFGQTSDPQPSAGTGHSARQTQALQTAKRDEETLNKYSIDELKAELISRGNKTLYGSTHSDLETIGSSAIIEKINNDEKSLYNPRGLDRRRDFWEIQDPTQLTVTNSIVAFVAPAHYLEDKDTLHLTGPNLGQFKHLCSDQIYFDQPVAAYCSGFVVGSDLIVTAGHCVDSPIALAGIRIIFGYRRTRTAKGFRIQTEIPKRDVYKISQIIEKKRNDNGADYALIQVDRKIRDHLPLPLDFDNPVAENDELYAIGFPTGLPMKLADQAFVRAVSPDGYFVSNLDTFSGNSGSPVLRANSLEVVGILVRGGTDYTAKRDYCQVAFVCPEVQGCRGEDSTLVSALSDNAKEKLGVKPPRAPFTATFDSPEYPSGIGSNSSPQYTLTSSPTPPGFKIAHFEYSLSGDRSCNQWSICSAAVDGDRVVLHFSMQGHSEWMLPLRAGGPGLAPGQAKSAGHLVVTYQPI